MLQIAICEDLEEEANGLSASLEALLDKRQLPHVISLFSSGEELIAALECGLQFDLCLLDIYLAGLNGVDAARRVKELAPSIQVAFTTSSREFAVETFDLDAVYYLVKPVTEEKLRTLVERFLRRQKKPVTKLTITTPVKDYVFPLQRVVKIQSNNKGVDIYLHGEPQRIPLSFVRVEEQLDEERFLRISRGFIVQMDAILRLDGDVCLLKDGTSALISRRERKEIRRRYNDYLFSKP